MKNKKNKELLGLFNEIIKNIDESPHINNEEIKKSKNKIIYGKEGSGKSTYIMKNIINENIKNNIVYISPSTRQSIEKYNTFNDLLENNKNSYNIKSYNLMSQSEVCRNLISCNNEQIMSLLKNKQENFFELSIYSINNEKKIMDRNFIFERCKSLNLKFENETKILYNTNEVITKLLSFFSNCIHNKDFKTNLLIPIKIYNNKNNSDEKLEFGRSKEEKLILFKDDIYKYIDDIYFDNEKLESVIYDMSHYLNHNDIECGNKLYIIYISNRCLKYHGKVIENNLKLSENILKNDYKKDIKKVYFMEYFNFYNKVIDPLLNNLTKNLDELDKILDTIKNIEDVENTFKNIKKDVINKIKNFNIINDELPVNITNLVPIDEIKFDTKYSNITSKKIDKKVTADIYFDNEKKRYKSKPYANIEKLNRYKNLFNKLDEIFKNYSNEDELYNIYSYIKNIYNKNNLNYLFTMFNKNTTVLTSELLPTIILSLFDFNVYHMPDNDIKINEKIKADILLLKNKDIRIQKSNVEFVNNYINLLKNQFERKDKHLFVGNKTFKTDISIQSLKGSNNIIVDENDQINYESINIFINPNPPDIGFSSKILFKDAILNNIENIKNDEMKKMFFKKIYNRIKNNESIVHDIFSHIRYSDDINQSLGRILGRRSKIFEKIFEDSEINMKINCFLPIVIEKDDINLTQLTLNRIKTRFDKQVNIIFDESSIINDYENLKKIKLNEEYKLINANKMLEISLTSPKFNQTLEYIEKIYGLKIEEPYNIDENLINRIKTTFSNFKKLKIFNSKKTLLFYDIMKKLNSIIFNVNDCEIKLNINDKKEELTDEEIENMLKKYDSITKNNNLIINMKMTEMNNSLKKLKDKYITNANTVKDDFIKIFRKNSHLNRLFEDLNNDINDLPEKIKEKLEKINNDYITKNIIEKMLILRLSLFISLLNLEFYYNKTNRKEIFDFIKVNLKKLKEEYDIPDFSILISELINEHMLFDEYKLELNKGFYSIKEDNEKSNLSDIIKNIEDNYNNIKEIKKNKSGYKKFNDLNKNENDKIFENLKKEYFYNHEVEFKFYRSLNENHNINLFDKEKFIIEKNYAKDDNDELYRNIKFYKNLIDRSNSEIFKILYNYKFSNYEIINNYIFKNNFDNLIFDIFNKYTKTPIFNEIKLNVKERIMDYQNNNQFMINFANVNLSTDEENNVLGRYIDSFVNLPKTKRRKTKEYHVDKIIKKIENKNLKTVEILKKELFKDIYKYDPEYIMKNICNTKELSKKDTIINIFHSCMEDNPKYIKHNTRRSFFDKLNLIKYDFDNDEIEKLKNTIKSRIFNIFTKNDTYNNKYFESVEERNKGIYNNLEDYLKNIKSCFASLNIFNSTNILKNMIEII